MHPNIDCMCAEGEEKNASTCFELEREGETESSGCSHGKFFWPCPPEIVSVWQMCEIICFARTRTYQALKEAAKSPAAMDVIFIRHGQSEANASDVRS